MSARRIRAALELELQAWAQGQDVPVVWQGARTAVTGEHVRVFLLPGLTISRDVAMRQRHYTGVFQASVFVPANTGTGRAETLADSLEAAFPAGQMFRQGELVVRVTAPVSVRPAVVETDWLSVPCDFRYAAIEYL